MQSAISLEYYIFLILLKCHYYFRPAIWFQLFKSNNTSSKKVNSLQSQLTCLPGESSDSLKHKRFKEQNYFSLK